MSFTLQDFKKGGKYTIFACDTLTGEIYDAIPEKAIASIASHFKISNEEALAMLSFAELDCPSKNTSFWVEPK